MSGQADPRRSATGDAPHESAALHVTGEAVYVDDVPGGLVSGVVRSPIARGRFRLDLDAASAVPGVVRILTAADVPGVLRIGPMVHDEPVLADGEVFCVGQPLALVIGEDLRAVRAAVARARVDVEPLPAIDRIEDAIAAGSYLLDAHVMRRGDVDGALAGAVHRVEAEVRTGGQEHFYLESQAALAIPEEQGNYRVLSSTQHPAEVQADVAAVLGIGRHRVVAEVPRLGGGFGGKESQASGVAALAALGAWATGRPVRLVLHRADDMVGTGKRHPFLLRYRAGFDADLRLVALSADLYADGGWTTDLTGPIVDRALFHVDNAAFIPALRITGHACRTNRPSNTAFRGFGGPQGMAVLHDAVERLAERLGADPLAIWRASMYGPPPRDVAPFGQTVPWADNRLPAMLARLQETSGWTRRRAEVAAWNAGQAHRKRGLGIFPVKFGISFTNSVLNQAGALVHVYRDGTVALHHGGTEMGQGLHTKMRAVCAAAFGLDVSLVRVMRTATDKVPNTVATAASSGSDLNGMAVAAACDELKRRMAAVAAEHLGLDPDAVEFLAGRVGAGDVAMPFAALADRCFVVQVSLSATGYYRTPDIAYDRQAGCGKPFHYFAYGAAVVEAEVCGRTGMHRLLAADILHDVGASLSAAIDRGQVEGAFVQGVGWLTSEELVWRDGRLLTEGPSTYKIPAAGDAPLRMDVELLPHAPQPGTIHGSKAVGEPPFMLAYAAVSALRAAVAAFGPAGREVELALPATPEATLRAIERQRAP